MINSPRISLDEYSVLLFTLITPSNLSMREKDAFLSQGSPLPAKAMDAGEAQSLKGTVSLWCFRFSLSHSMLVPSFPTEWRFRHGWTMMPVFTEGIRPVLDLKTHE